MASRRGGGSAARRALRASGAGARSGRQDRVANGGAYRPLAERDAELRARFPIRLDLEDMRPGRGRW